MAYTTIAKVRQITRITNTTLLPDANITQFIAWADLVVDSDAGTATTAQKELLSSAFTAHIVQCYFDTPVQTNFTSEGLSISKVNRTPYLDMYERLLKTIGSGLSATSFAPFARRQVVPSDQVDQR